MQQIQKHKHDTAESITYHVLYADSCTMIELASHLTALRISSLRSSHDSYPSATLGSIMRSFDSIGPLLLTYCLVDTWGVKPPSGWATWVVVIFSGLVTWGIVVSAGSSGDATPK